MTVSDFKALYPNLIGSGETAVSDEVITKHLEEQKVLLNQSRLGSKYELLLGLLIAHEIKLDLLSKEPIPQDVTQIITARSTTAGSASILNMSKDFKDQYYSATSYGVKYLAYRTTKRFTGAVLS